MIYVRDDDVLIPSSSHEDPLKHFKTVHGWICETPKLLHVPTLLCRALTDYHTAREYIVKETAEGRMSPQIHGWEHIDYGKLSQIEVEDHLGLCTQFFWGAFKFIPTKWYTPWGASAPHLHEAAKNYGLELIDCSNINKMNGRYGIIQLAKEGHDIEKFMNEKEVFFHWWEGGMRLKRVVELLKHGTYEAAKAANRDWF